MKFWFLCVTVVGIERENSKNVTLVTFNQMVRYVTLISILQLSVYGKGLVMMCLC